MFSCDGQLIAAAITIPAVISNGIKVKKHMIGTHTEKTRLFLVACGQPCHKVVHKVVARL